MALVLSKANWKDVAIKDEWFKFKDKTPNGYIPVLSVDGGELMDGTIALVRFVCQRHGLYSQNPREKYLIERWVDIIHSECRMTDEGLFEKGVDKIKWLKERSM